jgi:hypothetical protein
LFGTPPRQLGVSGHCGKPGPLRYI